MTRYTATVHLRTTDATRVEQTLATRWSDRAAISDTQGGWISIVPQWTSEATLLDDLRGLATGLSASLKTVAVGLVRRAGAVVALIYESGAPAGAISTNEDILPRTPDELVAADPVEALLKLAIAGTDRDAIETLIQDERREASETLAALATMLGIAPDRAAADLASVVSGAGWTIIGQAPESASDAPAVPSDSRALAMYATTVALIAKAGELYESMERELGENPTPQMLERLDEGRRQYLLQLEEMLAGAALPGAPTMSELSQAAAQGDERLARLVAERTPEALDALAMHATRTGDADLLTALLRRGIDPNQADDENRTMLMIACLNHNAECVGPLLAAGADVNARDETGHTPLLHASTTCPGPVIRQLLNAGADPHATLPGGATATDLARFNPRRAEVVSALKSAE